MTETLSLYIVLKEDNFHKLMSGRIPKHDFDDVSMDQDFNSAISELKRMSKLKKCSHVICGIVYDMGTLLELYKNKKLIAPLCWLISHNLVDGLKIDPEDLKMLQEFYPTASFDFRNIVVNKCDIRSAYSVGSSGAAIRIFDK